MTSVTNATKISVVVASGSVMLLFSMVTLSALMPMLVGIMLMILGLAIEYRPSSVLGLLVALTAPALAADFSTLTDIGAVLAATVTLYIPSLFLAWAALSSEPGDAYELRILTRPFVRFSTMAAVCMLSVPAFALAVGLLLPTASTGMSTMAEMSVLLLATITTALLLARSSPSAVSGKVPEPLHDE